MAKKTKKAAKKKVTKKTTKKTWDNMSFTEALVSMKQGHKIRREKWKNEPGGKAISFSDDIPFLHFGNTKTKLNAINVESILANDWQIII